MNNQQMSMTDTLSLGFMTFAFFLGAGNLIFPPLAGFMAGEQMTPAMLGFLLTAVGMPLIGLIAVARVNGKMMQHLPTWAGVAIAVAIYVIIGPAFATPRAGLVAYEIGAMPFIDNANAMTQLIYTVIFFGIALALALNEGKLLDNVGKVLTPALLTLLVGLSIAIIILPGAEVQAPQGAYADGALFKGIIEGYGTMDALGSLMFGMLIIDILRKKGITESGAQTAALIKAAIIAAAGLAFVYLSLFYLGATAGPLAEGATNGGVILTNYVTHHFGQTGLILLSAVVTLACLTTAVGLISACADYFNSLLPKLGYKGWAILLAITCATVANIGLSQLIAISIPVLMAIYPVAIAIILLNLIIDRFAAPQLAFRLVITVAMLFGLIDGFNTAGVDMSFLNFLPLYAQGMAWLLPTLAAMGVAFVLKPNMQKVA